MINLTSREAKELAKPFIHERPEYGVENAMRLPEKQHGNQGIKIRVIKFKRNVIMWI